ncbi:MFS transporter [Conexibacter sp. CPCC 206217]|uniref:MFS transporter n=1 Tax=Conexibacter sp. CPCC 206217 TaxID=3064574 RepID=UPI0027188474|nr:MFS transporter [Conexibacter sp. CPCC 206217]MDO8212503.1 MFS transporter [Conexibacter sp. CPCC 206217]
MGALGKGAAWSPLRHRAFRIVWLTFLAVQIANWAETVGAVEVISEQSSSTLLLALVQTASTLPAVLFALPAGVAADMVDRRRLVIVLIALTAFAMAVLSGLVAGDMASPAVVLGLTFAMGATIAIAIPTFAALIQDLVPRADIANAVALNGISINLARVVGPALAGGILALVGAGVLFALLAAALSAMAITLLTAPRSTTPPPGKGERIGDALKVGLRFARSSRELQVCLVRGFLFVLPASAMWAVLPAVAVDSLHLDAAAFGGILGALGVGAVLGAQVLPHVRARFGLEPLILCGSVYAAVNLLVLGLVHVTAIVVVSLVLTGVAWMAVVSSLQTAAQLAARTRVRGRALSIYQLVFQGGMSGGSAIWGVVAQMAGLRPALLVAACGLLATLLARHRWPLAHAAEVITVGRAAPAGDAAAK